MYIVVGIFYDVNDFSNEDEDNDRSFIIAIRR